jgi:Ca-activated chloride channel family protein
VIMVVESDGANATGSDPMTAAEDARRLRIPVYRIGLGTPEGQLLQRNGPSIPVPPDLPTLQRIAERTGGRFFHAPTEEDLRDIYEELGSRIGFKKQTQEVTVVFAVAALLLLIAGATTSLTWTGWLL